jgi:hypothetical protein
LAAISKGNSYNQANETNHLCLLNKIELLKLTKVLSLYVVEEDIVYTPSLTLQLVQLLNDGQMRE